MVIAWLTPVSSSAQEPRSARPAVDDVLVKAGDATLTPLIPADIPIASTPVIAWPMSPADQTVRSGSRLNRVLLMRLEPESLDPKTRALSADGVVADLGHLHAHRLRYRVVVGRRTGALL